MTPAFLSFTLADVCGEGEFQECVMTTDTNLEFAPLLTVHFERPAEVGSRFTYGGLIWELTEERVAGRGAIEGGNTFWEARPVEH